MAYKEEDFLMLSGIQHFSFCRRQWALIHIENMWSENLLTAEGRIEHERVHDTGNTDSRGGILTIRGLDIKSAELGISGSCDAVEFIPDKNGVTLFGREGKWKLRPVEYKHGKSKANDCDRLQTAAQAMCLEEMFCCDIPEGAIFYFETRRREYFDITSELREKVKSVFGEMHRYYASGYTPKAKPNNKNCGKCSLADMCLPKLLKRCDKETVRSYVEEHTGEAEL